MASKNTEQGILKLMMEFYVDGASLGAAFSKAEAEYFRLHKKTSELSKKEQIKLYEEGVKRSKQSQVRIQKDTIESNKRTNKLIEADNAKSRRAEESRSNASNKKIADDKKNSFTGGWGNFDKKLGTISSYGGAIAIINAVRQAITFAITKAIELEAAFVDLAVKSGYTNSEMTKVADTIVQVASATQFSTLEITGAATALGKLGFEAEEVVKILPHVGNVAAATGETLQATAEVFGKVINAYSFSADAAGLVADRLVDIFNNSALNLEKFNTAFSYVGSAAASTGTSFNELTAAMAVLSDRGITASKIGTGLRNVFTKLGEEGDSLRNILQRINEAHLSFYEVAELVGRRAANQLFIMANSLDEFDANVARSADQFGESMKAAAIQMDTFKAKWDILINTITNALIPEFDADETFRDSLKDRISLLDELNILLDTTGKNKNNKISGILAQLPDFRREFEAAKATLDASLSDRDILKELIRIEDEKTGYNSLLSSRWGNKESDYAKGLREVRMLLDEGENLLTDNATKFNEDKAKDRAQTYVENFELLLEQAISGIDVQQGNKKRNVFLDGFLFGGNQEEAKKVLKDQVKFGKLTTEQYLELIQGFGEKQSEWVEKVKKDYQKYDDVNLLSAIAEGYERERDAIRRINNGDDELTNKTDANDEAGILKRIEKRQAFMERMCKIDSNFVLKNYGFVCKEVTDKKTKDNTVIGQIDRLTQLREAYKTAKDSLTKQYADEETPQGKAIINDALITLEKNFRSQLNSEYEYYLNQQAAIRSAFCAKHPTLCNEFDENFKKTGESQIKDAAEGDRNLNTYSDRGLAIDVDGYKQAIEAKATYAEKVSAIDLKLRSLDKKDKKERRKLLDDRNEASKQYYIDAEMALSLHYTKLELLLKQTREDNLKYLADGNFGSIIDTTDLQKQIEMYKAEIKLLREEANKAQKTGNRSDREDYDFFDYFDAAMQMSEDVYNVYKEAGDRKLALLEEQTARELQVIQDRFDREGVIRNSALESGIISQEQATEAEERARRNRIDNENKVNKKLFEAQKKRDKEDAIFQGLSATAEATVNAFKGNPPPVAVIMAAISAAAIATSTLNNIKAISQRKFVPQIYADGGIIEGKSHAQGGVPFTVNGRAGFEAEGGEFIVNKEATARHLDELKRINAKTKTSNYKFATGGFISSDVDDTPFNRAVLEALSNPVRAYVTDQDLEKSRSEREALTKKTTY